VYVSLHDRTKRVVGATDLGPHFEQDISELQVGQEVGLMVFNLNEVGAQVVVSGCYRGIVYHDDTMTRLQRGQRLTGWIETIREDARVDVTLRRRGREANDEAREIVLRALAEAGGSLPLHDKSPPEDIRAALKLSKKVFKKALGGLYKERLIELGDGSIALTKAGRSLQAARDAAKDAST
jgi:predicted RNA-binding protein (virulence factor B family)